MKIPIRNVYYLLCYAWSHLKETDLVDRGTLDRLDQVQDLLAKVLAEGTFRLVRRGVDQGYREVTSEVPGLRGKLEVSRTATRNSTLRGRTVCRFEEFSPDVLHNRILRSTLDRLRRLPNLDEKVQRDVVLAHQKLAPIRVMKVRGRHFRRLQLDRNLRMYRFLMAVCRLVHESMLVDESSGEVPFHDFRRDEATMWKLFEEFALEFFLREQDRFQVQGQSHVAWVVRGNRSAQTYLPAMSPDIVLESSERRVILDTKFYSSPLNRKLDSKNLYQLLTYLENREGTASAGPRHEGILLYAAVEHSFRIEVELQGFRVQARTVDLSQPWHRVREEMMDVLEIEPPALRASQ